MGGHSSYQILRAVPSWAGTLFLLESKLSMLLLVQACASNQTHLEVSAFCSSQVPAALMEPTPYGASGHKCA